MVLGGDYSITLEITHNAASLVIENLKDDELIGYEDFEGIFKETIQKKCPEFYKKSFEKEFKGEIPFVNLDILKKLINVAKEYRIDMSTIPDDLKLVRYYEPDSPTTLPGKDDDSER